MRLTKSTLALALFLPLLARAAPPASVQEEVGHLLGYIARSGCEFFRNGVWASATVAQGHVQSKYEYLLRQDKIATAKDFIDKAASESSLSGLPYQVRCGQRSPVPSRAWLSEELARYQSRPLSAR